MKNVTENLDLETPAHNRGFFLRVKCFLDPYYKVCIIVVL